MNRLTAERLEERDTPSTGGVWFYDENGHVRGKALHADPVHPAWVYNPALAPGRETVGTGYVVYEEGASKVVVDATARYYAGLWDVVEFTNVRPDLPTDKFLTVHFGVPHDFFVAQGFPGAVGLSGVGIVTRPGGPDENWVQYPGDVPLSASLAARTAAHEVGHAFGLEHNAVWGSLMYGSLSGDNSAAAFVGTERDTIRESATEAVK